MKIPLETVMKLPIQDRKYYIMRHNYDVEMEERKQRGGDNDVTYSSSESINLFAKNQTEYEKNKSGIK